MVIYASNFTSKLRINFVCKLNAKFLINIMFKTVNTKELYVRIVCKEVYFLGKTTGRISISNLNSCGKCASDSIGATTMGTVGTGHPNF